MSNNLHDAALALLVDYQVQVRELEGTHAKGVRLLAKKAQGEFFYLVRKMPITEEALTTLAEAYWSCWIVPEKQISKFAFWLCIERGVAGDWDRIFKSTRPTVPCECAQCGEPIRYEIRTRKQLREFRANDGKPPLNLNVICDECWNNPPKKLKNLPYDLYLKTQHWKAVRARAIKGSGGACEKCGATTNLQVHHLTYERIGEELDSDLMVLCASCHKAEHSALQGGQERAS